MKKKIILLFLIIFLASGCTIKYNIEIYNGEVRETIDLVEKDIDTMDELETKMYANFDKYQVYDGVNKHFEPYEKDHYYAFRSKETYDFDAYNSNIKPISNSCRDISFVDDGKYTTFQMLGYLKWFEKYEDLDEIELVIKSNHKVKEHNADETGRHTYIWHINKDNYKEKIPMIKLYSNKYVFNYNNEFIKKILPIIVFVGIILGGSGITYLHFRNKSRKADAI